MAFKALWSFGAIAWARCRWTNRRAGGAGAVPRDSRCSKSNPELLCPCVRQYLTSFFSCKCEVQGFCGVLDWAEVGWDTQETPSAHFPFCIVAEKGRTFNRSALSFLPSKPMGQLTSADTWKSHFGLPTFQTQLVARPWLTHLQVRKTSSSSPSLQCLV